MGRGFCWQAVGRLGQQGKGYLAAVMNAYGDKVGQMFGSAVINEIKKN